MREHDLYSYIDQLNYVVTRAAAINLIYFLPSPIIITLDVGSIADLGVPWLLKLVSKFRRAVGSMAGYFIGPCVVHRWSSRAVLRDADTIAHQPLRRVDRPNLDRDLAAGTVLTEAITSVSLHTDNRCWLWLLMLRWFQSYLASSEIGCRSRGDM